MKLEAYRFFEDLELTDYEKVFAWFFTKIHQSDTDIDAVYTIAKYDLQILMKGTIKGMFSVQTLNPIIKEWIRIGFVNNVRATLQLTEKSKSVFRLYRNEMMCGKECLEITNQRAIMIYYYLLGILGGSDSMFNDMPNFGQGEYSDTEYSLKTGLLNRVEISELLNA